MKPLVAYATKARKVADKMGDPWKNKKKPGRPPYSPRVVVITKAIREYLGSTYDKQERTIAVNARLVKAVGAPRLPAKGTLDEMSKKIPADYYRKFKSKVGS